MNLKDYYRNLHEQSVKAITEDRYQMDALMDTKEDLRRGLTLLIRPPQTVKNNIRQFLTTVEKIAPAQYYYPNSDIHVTVLSIVSCYAGFEFPEGRIFEYIRLVKKSLHKTKPWQINFKGIIASPSGILLRGYPDSSWLDEVRDQLRAEFKNSNLEQSIDRRYTIRTAHATVIRFRKNLENKKVLLELLDQYQDYDFGSFNVNEIELVYNDWYQKKELTKVVSKFDLSHPHF